MENFSSRQKSLDGRQGVRNLRAQINLSRGIEKRKDCRAGREILPHAFMEKPFLFYENMAVVGGNLLFEGFDPMKQGFQ